MKLHYLLHTLFVLLLSIGFSQSAVMIDPPAILLNAQPAQEINRSVTVVNPTPTALRIRLYLSDWEFDPSGGPNYLDVGQVERSASNWIRFTPSQVELAPGESAEVRYTINVPVAVEQGTHWSMLFFEAEPIDVTPGESLATFSVRIGHTIYVNVAPIQKSGRITGIFDQVPSEAGEPYRFIVQYLNDGNAAYGLEGRFELRDMMGEVAMNFPITRDIVLPGAPRILIVELEGPLDAGQYTALFILNYGDEDIDVAGDKSFVLTEPLYERSE